MKRVSSNILCATSVLMCVSALVLRFRSHDQRDCVTLLNSSGSGIFISTGPGLISTGTLQDLKQPAVDGDVWKSGLNFTSNSWSAIRISDDLMGHPEQNVGSGRSSGIGILDNGTICNMNIWDDPAYQFWGFGWDFSKPSSRRFEFGASDYHASLFVAPLWFVNVICAAMPTWRMIRFTRCRYRMTHGRCQICSYDLRASSNRCPECGTPIALAASAANLARVS